MVQSKDKVSAPAGEVSERDMRRSGIPTPGRLGAAKKEAWALTLGIMVVVLIIVAAVIDVQV